MTTGTASFNILASMLNSFILDMTTDDNQEGVMDNLLEALKTGSAFNVNREKRDGKRRTPRAAGAERRAQLARSRSRQNLLDSSTVREIDFDESSRELNNNNSRIRTSSNLSVDEGPRRRGDSGLSEAEQLLERLKAL
ncbi:diaphanous-related formin [Elysia marginata]|uniref:Diaphanous-related formin n=1 Tax=Elysia marginata TaxID=1093978 RepID=A0AAV4ELJ0_9GAST|nr:diaphanous-related formin [Elysia marginata]